jgi:hypothetical protein
METSFRLPRWFVQILFPFIVIAGHIKLRFSEPVVGEDDFLSYQAGNFSNLAIPGKYKHLAIYIGFGIVVQATSQGVGVETLEKFMTEKDSVYHTRPLFCTGEEAQKISAYALAIASRPKKQREYDYFFDEGDKAFYCCEVYVYSATKIVPGKVSFINRLIWGVKTTLPDDFRLAEKHFGKVGEYGVYVKTL